MVLVCSGYSLSEKNLNGSFCLFCPFLLDENFFLPIYGFMNNSFDFNDDGAPLCPLCGNILMYILKTVSSSEYQVVGAEFDSQDDDDSIIFPTVYEQPDLKETLETLSRRIECSSMDCDLVLEENLVGDVEYINTEHYGYNSF